MGPDTRNQRMAAALEEEFQSCHNLLSGALAGVAKRGSFQDWEMRSILGLMRTTAQVAAIISKLQGKAPQKNLENRGSIPQENCG